MLASHSLQPLANNTFNKYVFALRQTQHVERFPGAPYKITLRSIFHYRYLIVLKLVVPPPSKKGRISSSTWKLVSALEGRKETQRTTHLHPASLFLQRNWHAHSFALHGKPGFSWQLHVFHSQSVAWETCLPLAFPTFSRIPGVVRLLEGQVTTSPRQALEHVSLWAKRCKAITLVPSRHVSPPPRLGERHRERARKQGRAWSMQRMRH